MPRVPVSAAMKYKGVALCLLPVVISATGSMVRLYAVDTNVKPSSATTDTVTQPTTDTGENNGPTSPNRVLPGEPPLRKNYWIPAVEIPSFLLILNGADRLIYPHNVYDSNLTTFKNHFLHGPWQYDNDPFNINQVGHPYQGATMFGFARSSGLNFWESLGYANAGSVLWKLGGETDAPSINDQITTGQAGSILGEELYRMASLVLERGGSQPDAWREWFAAFISPPTGLNRLIFGDRFKPVESRHPATFTRVELGATNTVSVRDSQGLSRPIAQNGATGDFSMAYGLPGKPGYRYIRPLDYFNFEIAGTASTTNSFPVILTRGLLVGVPYEQDDHYRGVWGLYGSYDYMSPQIFRVSSTAASLGTTGQWWLSRTVALQDTAMGGVGFGAAGVTSGEQSSNYHYGATPQGLLALRLILGDRMMLDTTAREYYVSNVGAPGNATDNIARIDASFMVRVWHRHAVGIQYVYTRRDADYAHLPSQVQAVSTIGLAYNFLGDRHFGAVAWGDNRVNDPDDY